jgi:hypothetical protein
MSFKERLPRREAAGGTSVFSRYRAFWRGAGATPWVPWLAPASSLRSALASAHARDLASDLPAAPGVFELALSPPDAPDTRVKVYVAASADLQRELVALCDAGGGSLAGWLDHALKKGHAVWLRARSVASAEAADACAERILGAYDYAWVAQPGARARSLVVRRETMCCCFPAPPRINEGPPKFVAAGGQGSGLLGMLSKRSAGAPAAGATGGGLLGVLSGSKRSAAAAGPSNLATMLGAK